MRTKGKTGAANPPDTRGVVNTVRGHALQGKQRVSGNDAGRNSMVSANASRKRK